MDDFARLPPRERTDAFVVVATQRGNLRQELVEKDFWVCWALKHLFESGGLGPRLIFKGGTSLSKVYRAINRFSEDVDLSVDREQLGFGGPNDPAAAPSKKKRNARLDDLVIACQAWIRCEFLPHLGKVFEQSLQKHPSPGTWKLELDSADPQTILFHYPATPSRTMAALAAYIRPAVRLEFGARGEPWPTERKRIIPYAAESLPELFKQPDCPVTVLAAERTFWEKAVALHAWHHFRTDRPIPERSARHYYDVAMLYSSGIGRRALDDLELLLKVKDHKAVFFASSWARYDLAVPGSLRLLPPLSRRDELARDYRMMQELFFEAAPSLDEIYMLLDEIERRVNARS